VRDRNRPDADRQGSRLPDEEIEAYGFTVGPRGTAEVALSPHLSLMVAGGVGARSSDAAALSDAEFAPFARVTAGETGARYSRTWSGLSLEARTGVFGTRVDQDLVFDEIAGRNIPLGPSNRLGLFGSTRITAAESLDLQLSTAFTRATLAQPGAELEAWFGGPALPYVPRMISRADLSYRRHFQYQGQQARWSVALGHAFIGPRPLPLGRFSEPISLFDAAARVLWRGWEVGLEVDNLLDVRWREAEFNYVSNFRGAEAAPSLMASRHFSAGTPRQLRGTLTYHFE
jgi:iron complex outermembrane recepter protein